MRRTALSRAGARHPMRPQVAAACPRRCSRQYDQGCNAARNGPDALPPLHPHAMQTGISRRVRSQCRQTKPAAGHLQCGLAFPAACGAIPQQAGNPRAFRCRQVASRHAPAARCDQCRQILHAGKQQPAAPAQIACPWRPPAAKRVVFGTARGALRHCSTRRWRSRFLFERCHSGHTFPALRRRSFCRIAGMRQGMPAGLHDCPGRSF